MKAHICIVRLYTAAAGLAVALGACGEGGTSPELLPSDTVPGTPLPGTWVSAAPLPLARWSSGVAEFQGLIYVAGGFVGNGGGSREVFRYDPSADSWDRAADLPFARVDMPLAVVGDTLYAVAGLFEPGNAPPFPVNSLWLYDIANDQWVPRAPLSLAVGASAAAEVNGLLWVVGGRTGPFLGDVLDSVLVYDPSTDSWSRTVPLPVPRSELAVHVVDGLLYAVGGITGDNSLSRRVDILDLASGTWSLGSNLGLGRRGFASALLRGQIHILTGQIGVREVPEHERYDIRSNQWTSLAEVPTPRRDASAIAGAGRVFVIGGTVAGNAVNLVEEFSITP